MAIERLIKNNKRIKISFIGAGNVATHLACAFFELGIEIVSINARTLESATILANKVNAKAFDTLSLVPTDVDFVIISTNDSSVVEIASKLPKDKAIVLHTSGSIPLELVAKYHANCGVLYPLQTFSKDVEIDIRRIPFFTEASNTDDLESIDYLARIISDVVYHADSEKRQKLHIAGVLTSNFPIYLLEIAERVLGTAEYPIDVVKPLLEATIAKAFSIGPRDALTGPARRGDKDVVKLHYGKLGESDSEIYKVISNAILKEFHGEQI